MTLTSLQEGISGVRVIQAFSREDVEVKRFSRRNRGLYDEYMHSVWISCWYLPVIEFAGLATTALVIGVGGAMALHGVVTIGTITFFVLSLSNLFDPVQQLSQYVNQVQSAGAGLDKLADLLESRSRCPTRRTRCPRRPGDLDVRGVVRVRRRRRVACALPAGRRRRSPTCRAVRAVGREPDDRARGSGSRWWARPGRASRRWPSSSPASTTRSPAR